MPDFHLDASAVEERLRWARRGATAEAAGRVLDHARRGEGLDPEDLGVLWCAAVASDAIYEAARELHRARAGQLETFSPLYMTNTCDAECRMCGMRRDNQALTRETAEIAGVIEQLRLLSRRGMRAVALLTGEYAGANRPWAMRYVNQALHATQQMRFNHVLLNVGSIDEDEFETVLSGLARNPDGSVAATLTMSTFQETYSPQVYAKFMGSNPYNPRADFGRRLTNFDRAYRAGMRGANPGILVGLNPDVAYELTALALHARHLLARGMEVYVSVPRLRRVAGSGSQRGIGDDEFVRLVAILSLALPAGKIVITTRENAAMQEKLAPIVSVISAGSAAVAPYTETGARFPLETSQFEVIDQRPFEAVLQEHCDAGATITNFEPPATAAAGWQSV
jgi:2-iminoacetate synthase